MRLGSWCNNFVMFVKWSIKGVMNGEEVIFIENTEQDSMQTTKTIVNIVRSYKELGTKMFSIPPFWHNCHRSERYR